MAPERLGASDGHHTVAIPDAELPRLFHQLNNQLGVILANAELLEKRLADETQRARAGQVVTSVLEAIALVQRIRQAVESPAESRQS